MASERLETQTCNTCPLNLSCWSGTSLFMFCGTCEYTLTLASTGFIFLVCEGMTDAGMELKKPRPRRLDMLHGAGKCPHCACAGSRTYIG
jgi:hypothetical protein